MKKPRSAFRPVRTQTEKGYKYKDLGVFAQVITWNRCAVKGCDKYCRNKHNGREKYIYCPEHSLERDRYNNVKGNIDVLIEEKYEELTKYLMSKCYSWRADYSRYDDIVQNTIERLIREDQKKPFEDARQLWGRATNIVKEEIAQTFADRLPVSGVKFQAHWTATKALQAAGDDPGAAYTMQTGTSRVGRELIYAVAHGPSLYSPEYLSEIEIAESADTSSLSQQDEDNVRVAMFDLTEQERQVVHLRMWMRLTNAQVGEEMGLSAERVRKIWQKALRTMKPLLEKSLGGRYVDA